MTVAEEVLSGLRSSEELNEPAVGEMAFFRGTVAAIVPNYNCGQFLREAVDSLERQTSPPDEIVIIDDASTDESETVLQDLEAKGHRVVRNKCNLGSVETFRRAVALTQANYIFFLNPDSRIRSDYILKCRTALDRADDIAVAYSDVSIFDSRSGELTQTAGAAIVGEKPAEKKNVYYWRFPEPDDEAIRTFATKNFVHGSSMYRRSYYQKVGGYRASNGPHDHDLFSRMSRAGGRLQHVPYPLLEYRHRSPQQANSVVSLLALETKTLRDLLAEKERDHAALTRETEALRGQLGERARANAALQQQNTKAQDPLIRAREKLAQLQEAYSRIQQSSSWPLIRILRSLRHRLRQIHLIALDASKILESDIPSASLAATRSQDALIEAIPEIARVLKEYGSRPGGWIAPHITKLFQRQGITLVANTFYSVNPDLNELHDHDWRAKKYETAWELVKSKPLDLMLAEISRFVSELSDIPSSIPDEEGRFYWDNPMFSPLDAAAYYGVIRSSKPKRIIEVGSGYSTSVALRALDQSSLSGKLTCIEPYPSPFLRKNERRLAALMVEKIQSVEPSMFEPLEKNDILFIDSSHCSRLSSDLNFLIFEVIPRLKPGVLIHFHDIFLPYEYPRNWIEDIGIMWNEQYMILALLMLSDSFEVLWSSSNAGASRRLDIEQMFVGVMPKGSSFLNNLGPYSGGSIWIRKTR